METAKVDIRKLQLLNDRIAQCAEALNQVRLSVHGLAYGAGYGQAGVSGLMQNPGFAVGAHTLVSPTAVVLGPLPMFPLLAALPDDGATPGWTVGLLALPPLVAALAVFRTLLRYPTTRWDEAALRGVGAGLGCAVVFALLAVLAGGAVGPGRMTDVGPSAFQVLLHGIATFGIGGLLGGLLATWRHRTT